MKKVLCLLLCMVLLCGVLASCNGGGEPAETTTTPSGGGDVTTTTPPTGGNNNTTTTTNGDNAGTTTLPAGKATQYPKHEYYSFADSLGNPRAYTMLVRQNRYAYLYGTESSTADVSIAAYRRNNLLNAMYDITIGIEQGGGDGKPDEFNTKLGAGAGVYSLAVPDYWWGIEYAGHFRNLMSIPEIDENDDYWFAGWNDSLIINNRLYTIVGDATLELLENLEMIYYNKTLEEAWDLDLYGKVEDGEWTIEYVAELADAFSSTLMDPDPNNDTYAINYDQHTIVGQLYSAGATFLQTNRHNNIITPIFDTSRNVELVTQMGDLCQKVAVYYEAHTARANSENRELFKNGQSLLLASCLYMGSYIRNEVNSSFEYGLLVMPKLYEEDDYVTTSYGLSFFGIPDAANDVAFCAVVMDSMNWLSGDVSEEDGGMGENCLTTVYFKGVVQGQLVDSPEDVEMLNTMRESVFFDFEFIVSTGIEGAFSKAVRAGEAVDVSSVKANAETEITTMMEFYNK